MTTDVKRLLPLSCAFLVCKRQTLSFNIPRQSLAKKTPNNSLNMAIVSSLAEDLENLISPWTESETQPPFSTVELAVMALAIKGKALTFTDIIEWVIGTFRYHHKHRDTIRGHRDVEFSAYAVGEALRGLDAPVSEGLGVIGPRVWTIALPEARIFFAARLRAPEAAQIEQPFPLLRLPPELRLKIYEMVLALPPSGICLTSVSNVQTSPAGHCSVLRRSVFRASTRSYDTAMDYASIASSGKFDKLLFRSRPATVLLALLQCCKQIFSEAVHIFYSINHFYCGSLFSLAAMLEQTPAGRRKYIKHISFAWHPYAEGDSAKAFRLLKEAEGLQRLDIMTSESAWEKSVKIRGKQRGAKRHVDLLKLPGLATLRTVRGIPAVNFHGDCATLAAYLLPEMRKSKQAAKLKAGPKKRLAVDGDEHKIERRPKMLKEAAKQT